MLHNFQANKNCREVRLRCSAKNYALFIFRLNYNHIRRCGAACTSLSRLTDTYTII